MNKMTGIILMITGSIVVVAGLIIFGLSAMDKKPVQVENEYDKKYERIVADGILTKNENDSLKKIVNETSLAHDKRINDLEHKIKTNLSKTDAELVDQDKKNGDDFEKYIVQKFNKKYFKIKEWTGDKYINGIYAENTLYPDILFEFKLKEETKSFAVECKWRKNLFKNGIEFAKPDQLERYRKYEREKHISVYIAIGINGKASEPNNLYIIPLKNIKNTFVHANELKLYEKDRADHFFYNLKTEMLN